MSVLDTFSLKGKKVLVTGGAGGYGTHISEAVAEAGATTIIASRAEQKRQKVIDSLTEAGYEAYSYYLDQGKEEAISKLHQELTERFGPMDVLINGAVLRPCHGYDCTLDEWRESMEVNSTGLLHITRLFAQEMIKQRSGSIINIASIYGMVAPTFALYEGMPPAMGDVAADYWFNKAGMINITRYFAARLGEHNIRVTAISPGGLSSEMTGEPFFSRYCQATFLGRMAGPNEIKGAIVFLASDASTYLTGINLPVDAGFTAH